MNDVIESSMGSQLENRGIDLVLDLSDALQSSRLFSIKDADQGTGLSIIYAIVRNHDGQNAVESEQGVGTMFRVMLSVVERDLPQTPP